MGMKWIPGPAPKEFCGAGHAMTGDNVAKRKDGSRRCAECERIRNQPTKYPGGVVELKSPHWGYKEETGEKPILLRGQK